MDPPPGKFAMTVILAIDTSQGSSVALVGPDFVHRRESENPRTHAEQLAGLIAAVLELGPDPDAVAVGTGPAPFTGLRAGLVTAESLGFARGIPVWGVPTLDALARAAIDTGLDQVTVVTDARRREVYAATYRADEADVARIGEFYVGPAAALQGKGPFVGSGTELFPAELPGEMALPDLAVLARLAIARAARGVAQPARPLYLRRPDAIVPAGLNRATT